MKHKYALQSFQTGFTLIELLIATTIFSVIFMICTFGILQVSRTYYKGITNSKTQQTARAILDQISQGIQFDGTTPVPTALSAPLEGVPAKFCVGGLRYSYMLNRQLSDTPNAALSQSKHVLVSDAPTACNSASAPLDLTDPSLDLSYNKAQELIAPNMRLARLSVETLTDNLYRITVRVVYGDNDLLDNKLDSGSNPVPPATADDVLDTCKTIRAGSQFCAASELSTVVQKRLK